MARVLPHHFTRAAARNSGEAMNTAMALRRAFFGFALGLALAGAIPATAATITLGDQDFADGTLLPGGTAQFLAPQGGEPAPIGQFLGSDVSSTSFSASWIFNLGAGPVTSASITFGIADHDSAAPGNQLLSFSVDGVDLTATLDALFEAPGVERKPKSTSSR
jgi:hypothetical protein